MNKIISLIIAGVIGASSIAGVNATLPQTKPEVKTEYIYIQSEPEIITETEYVYINASEKQLEEAFQDGYNQGASDGYGDGYAAGYHDCMNDLG